MKTDPSELDASPATIENCEPRLALSASLMGAWLAPLADPTQDLAADDAANSPAVDAPEFLPTCQATPAIEANLVNPIAIANQAFNDLPIAPAVLNPAASISSPGSATTESSLDQLFAQSTLNTDPSGDGDSLLDQAARIGSASQLDGYGQTIAVIDSGIAYDHLAFANESGQTGFGSGYRVVGGWDFAENDADPYDDAPSGYHGTHVAGLASGMTDTIDGDTFRGVAPGADLVALRVFDDDGNGNLAWIESSLRWVYDNQDSFEFPITTVNLSLGTELTDANRDYAYGLIEDELQLLFEDDILVFAAAGNGQVQLSPDADDLMYPASSSWVSAVGSVDTNGNLSGFSQRADDMFVAEGQQLQSSVPEHVLGYDGYVNDYTSLSGTSMSSPQVAAASILVRQAMQDAGIEATSESILQRMQDTSVEHVDPTTGVSYRSLDIEAAIDFGTSNSAEPEPGTETGDPSSEPAQAIAGYEGGSGADALELDLRSILSGDANSNLPLLTDSNGQYQISMDNETIVIDAGAGSDTLQIFGSTGNEQISLRPTTGANAGSSTIAFAGGVIELRGFENVTFIGGGGEDRATLYDSDGNDELRSSQDQAQLSGVGFEFQLEAVKKLYVHATAGGNDTAHLTDTEFDDQLVIRPQFSSMRGGDYFQAAFGFERVFAYAEAGGDDHADLGDSAGDDIMSISQTRSLISSSGYRASALGFESVEATASLGGDDTVRIYVDDPDGTWHTSESLTQWSGNDGTSRIARGFEHSQAFENYETVPVGSSSLSNDPSAVAATLVAESPAMTTNASDLERENDEHLRALRLLFEELA
ncbi:Serine protease, subtilisin family [Neorhodopirellula lusitana]|uniref:Serine protease, subtilisin family n=1 Tax=Neorhodopirellula lusitana TaxID=445327 RepID=A0ABY1QQL6_9BACT|nr:S8 family serine peptidase [Neorhodopirellula lusitana]SMP74904.1 Serine protease, subtilisin family [Neorhodopirellula lusitana]